MCTHGHPHISSHGPLKTSSQLAVGIHVSPIFTRLCCGRTLEVVSTLPFISPKPSPESTPQTRAPCRIEQHFTIFAKYFAQHFRKLNRSCAVAQAVHELAHLAAQRNSSTVEKRAAAPTAKLMIAGDKGTNLTFLGI